MRAALILAAAGMAFSMAGHGAAGQERPQELGEFKSEDWSQISALERMFSDPGRIQQTVNGIWTVCLSVGCIGAPPPLPPCLEIDKRKCLERMKDSLPGTLALERDMFLEAATGVKKPLLPAAPQLTQQSRPGCLGGVQRPAIVIGAAEIDLIDTSLDRAREDGTYFNFPWRDADRADFLRHVSAGGLAACSNAEAALQAFRSFDMGAGAIFRTIRTSEIAACAGQDVGKIAEKHGLLVKAYVEACLHPIAPRQVDGWDEAANAMTRAYSGRFRPSGSNFERDCTATLAQGRLYTARHCVADGDVLREAQNEFTFEPFDGAKLTFSLEGRLHSTPYYSGDVAEFADRSLPQEDVVAIDVGDLLQGGLSIGAAKPGEQLFLPGLNQNLYSQAQIANQGAPSDFRASAGIDTSPTCRIIYKSGNGCLVHSCQTEAMASGAPLIALRDGKPVIVGIQTGYQQTGTAELCPDPDGKLTSAGWNHAADPERVDLASVYRPAD